MTTNLPAGLPAPFTARPAVMTDAEAVTALIRACELHDHGQMLLALDDVTSDWRRPTLDLKRDSILVFDGESLIGQGEAISGRAETNVHPEARGRGVGTWLATWVDQTFRSKGETLVRQTLLAGADASAELLLTNGYTVGHVGWILRMELDEEPPPPNPAEGIEVRRYRPGEERAIYEVIEVAFSDWADREATSYEEWFVGNIDRENFDPSLLLVAAEGSDVVGACLELNYEEDEGGWIAQLAVRSSHRHRGIARALLQQAFVNCWERGERVLELSTDSRTGALTLYEKVGMRVKTSSTTYYKNL